MTLQVGNDVELADLESTIRTVNMSTKENGGEEKSLIHSHETRISNDEEAVTKKTITIPHNDNDDDSDNDDNAEEDDANAAAADDDDDDDDDVTDKNKDDVDKLGSSAMDYMKHRHERVGASESKQEGDVVGVPLTIQVQSRKTNGSQHDFHNTTGWRLTKVKMAAYEPEIVSADRLQTESQSNIEANLGNKSFEISQRKLDLSNSDVGHPQVLVAKPLHEDVKRSQSYRTFRLRQIRPTPSPIGLSKTITANTNVLSTVFNDSPHDMEYFSKPSVCPLLEIRRSRKRSENLTCIPREFPATTCIRASKEYSINSDPLKCSSELDHRLCSFKVSNNMSSQTKATIECNTTKCGKNPVYVLEVSPTFGILEERRLWKRFFTSRGLENYLQRYSNASAIHGFNFCYLACVEKERKGFIEQLFSFPSLHMLYSGTPQDKINFNLNILVLDSVSRPHFYRTLPKTVNTLREIVHFEFYNASVLDFEMMQSTAAYTFHNIRALMSGKKDFHYSGGHVNESYGIDVLFGKFKKLGFYTLLQEDSCWYDSWGSLFTDNKFQGEVPRNKPDFARRWKQFQEMVKHYNIDDFGLSHASCEVLQRYNTTNQFNQPRRVCFGGKAFAENFLDYTESIYNNLRVTGKPTRVLTYTHLNTGHEVSGTRIRQVDDRLSRYVEKMARVDDTLTIILSDHGPKTTKYSFYTMEGRAEKYDPFSFIIIPEKVARTLGLETVRALSENQNRLVTTLDLHKSLMSLGKTSLTGTAGITNGLRDRGIFDPIPSNRTCAHLSIKPLAVCKCEGWEKRFPDNDRQFTWLAEYALGSINNNIQEQYLKDVRNSQGYGNCQRLVGKRFSKIRQRSKRKTMVTTMDIHVTPGNEIFEVQIQHSHDLRKQTSFIKITHRERITIYRHFRKCADSTVSLGLCVCYQNNSYQSPTSGRQQKWVKINRRKDILEIISFSNSFGVETKVKDIHRGCLLLMYRNHGGRSTVFEIANTCNDRIYNVTISMTNAGKYFLSRKIPFSILVRQKTIHFMLVVKRSGKSNRNFKLKVSYLIQYLGL